MDDPYNRGRSPSLNAQHGSHIIHSHSPSPARPVQADGSSSMGLGLGIDQSSVGQGGLSDFSTFNPTGSEYVDSTDTQQFDQAANPTFDLNSTFTNELDASNLGFDQPGLANQPVQNTFSDDFTIFPSTGDEQFTSPLFSTDQGLNQSFSTPDNNMASIQPQHTPTPPHMLQPGSAHQSPSFHQGQFSSPPRGHSRNASLAPQDALMPGQTWGTGPQFQNHRRSPSDFSDASSAGHSPHMAAQETFEQLGHSPLQRPVDPSVYQELNAIGQFTLSDHGSQHSGRSPSHSPAISPRIMPQQMPEGMQQPGLVMPSTEYASPEFQGGEAFPQLSQGPVPDALGQMPIAQMSAPIIDITYAPQPALQGYTGRPSFDSDALTPPERGRPRQNRPRAHTDPYNTNLISFSREGSLIPNIGSDTGSVRSLSPFDGDSASPNRRRQSASAVPQNELALRLSQDITGADGGDGSGGPKRVQKHPATFQCTLCPKRFTRAYNLRSHLRTHTDERPFVCTVCGKAFARQHDRKRHEGLHSGEKKFVCKGDLKTGGQWGCGRRFARADALGRHFRSEAGRICIKPLLDEEIMERQRQWNEQQLAHQQQAAAQQMAMNGGMMAPPPGLDAQGFLTDASGNYMLPQALLAQYPALATLNWGAPNMQGGGDVSGMEDEHSGRSDYDDGDEAGYVSGPGTGFGPGASGENFGEMGYASDFGGR